MRILFLFKSDFSTIPLSILTLSAQLKKYGHKCEFIDLKFESDYFKSIIDFKPDVLAYSVVSFTWQYYQKINLKIKRKLSLFSVFGGPHCTIYPDFIKEEGVDAICVGEGEEAFIDLLEALKEGNDITNIKNIWVKKDGRVYKNDVREFIEDLDRIPFPDYDLIYKYKFYKKSGMYYIMTSRGCPFNCTYCINQFYKNLYNNKGKYVRRRSVDNVIEEISIAKNKYKLKLIIFNDDIFTLNKKWLKKLAIKYKKFISIPFEAYTRVDTIDEETIQVLHNMGCIAIYFGIESGDYSMRKEILNRKITDDQIVKTALAFKKYGIKTLAFNMLNLPGESFEQAMKTVELNNRSKIDYPMGFVFQPFPNIEITDYAERIGLYNPKKILFDDSLINGRGLVMNKDRKKIIRLKFLFIIASRYSFTLPLVKILIRLPLDFIYSIIQFISRGIMLSIVMYRPVVKQVALFYLNLPIQFSLGIFSKIRRRLKYKLPSK